MLLLEEKKGGGFHSINEISSNFGQSIYFTSYRESNKNFHVFSVLSSANDIKEITPCHVEISRDYYWGNEAEFKVAEYCKTVYVIFPKYFALSDALKLPILINKHLPKDKELVFVGERLSSLAVEIMHRELSELGRDDINIPESVTSTS